MKIVEATQKTCSAAVLVALVTILVLICVYFTLKGTVLPTEGTYRVTCSLFETRRQAEDFFSSNPEKYAYLDRDGDGKPCESLPAY